MLPIKGTSFLPHDFDPGMVRDFGCRQPLPRVLLEQPGYQVPGPAGQALEFQGLALEYFLAHQGHPLVAGPEELLGLEGRVTQVHFVEQAPKGPDVDLAITIGLAVFV